MKKQISILILFLIPIVSVLSQTDWEKHPANPFLLPGPPGSWDAISVESESVLFDGTIYHIWYGGLDGVFYRIGHATSIDGINWTKDPENPVLDVGLVGSWEESTVYLPCVLLHESVFHMYYNGVFGWVEQTGHATSPDGTIWTKDPQNPVLTTGPEGAWDDHQVFPMAGSVIFEDNLFKMWYGGANSSFIWNAGYATSVDGSVWIKDTVNNPIMLPGSTGQWDDYSVLPGPVIRIDGIYNIWYNGCNNENRWRIGYATSIDGIQWTRYPNPVLDYGPNGSWDYVQAWNGSVIFDSVNQVYKMWYTGGDFGVGNIGYATSIIVGIEDSGTDNNLSSILSVEPNPTSGAVHLRYSIFDTRYSILEVYSVNGVLVRTLHEGSVQPGEHEQAFDVSDLPDGLYFVRLQAGERVESQKLILLK